MKSVAYKIKSGRFRCRVGDVTTLRASKVASIHGYVIDTYLYRIIKKVLMRKVRVLLERQLVAQTNKQQRRVT